MLRFTPRRVDMEQLFNYCLVLIRKLNVFMKLRKIRNCLENFNSLKTWNNMDSSTSTSETSENVFLFVFISSLVSFRVCI